MTNEELECLEVKAKAAFISDASRSAVLALIAELRQTRRERDWLAENMPNSYTKSHCPEGKEASDCDPEPTADGKVCYECLLCWLEAARQATTER